MQNKNTHIWIVMLAILVLHGVLTAYGIANPQAFMEGDRAKTRLENIESFSSAIQADEGSVLDVMVQTGGPGDYSIHAILYTWTGQVGIIVAQVCLHMLAVVLVFHLGVLLFGSRSVGLGASLVYALFMGSLLHPHVLASEAIFNPLVVISIYCSVRYLLADGNARGWLLGAALTGSLASFVRVVFVLYPFVLAAIMLILDRRKGRFTNVALYLVISLSVPMLWATAHWMQTGVYSMGKSDHDLSVNLYGRVNRMSRIGGFEIEDGVEEHRMGLGSYAGYVATYPDVYLKTVSSDLVNFTLNTGVNTFFGRYLGRYEMPKKKRYWRNIRDQEGLVAMTKMMYSYSPALFFTNILASLVWFAYIIAAAIGLVSLVRYQHLPVSVKALLISYPIYLLVVSNLGTGIRWDLRTPMEFVFALLIAFGVARLVAIGKRLAHGAS